MLPRARVSVERGADRIQNENRSSLFRKLITRGCVAEFKNHLSNGSSSHRQGREHARGQHFRLVHSHVRATWNRRFASTESEEDRTRRNRLSLAKRMKKRILRGRVREVDNSVGDAATELVISGNHQGDAGQDFGGSSGRDASSGVRSGVLAFPNVPQIDDRPLRVRTCDSVVRQPRVSLKLAHCPLGVGAEDAVRRATRKPEDIESLLEHTNVSAMKVREAQVQRPIPERETRIDQRRPRLFSDDSVFRQRMPFLKRTYRLGGQPEEDAVNARRSEIVTEGQKASLYVFNGGASSAEPHRSHSRRCPSESVW
jgi:hypothetical protein